MATKIKTEKETSQQVGTVPNLGGPTTTILANQEILINRSWAQRYEELNRGADL